jgi:hypothetical protein
LILLGEFGLAEYVPLLEVAEPLQLCQLLLHVGAAFGSAPMQIVGVVVQ